MPLASAYGPAGTWSDYNSWDKARQNMQGGPIGALQSDLDIRTVMAYMSGEQPYVTGAGPKDLLGTWGIIERLAVPGGYIENVPFRYNDVGSLIKADKTNPKALGAQVDIPFEDNAPMSELEKLPYSKTQINITPVSMEQALAVSAQNNAGKAVPVSAQGFPQAPMTTSSSFTFGGLPQDIMTRMPTSEDFGPKPRAFDNPAAATVYDGVPNLGNANLGSMASAPPSTGATNLISPSTAGYNMTSGYGVRQDPFGLGSRMHAGIDFGMPAGTPISVAAPGRVTEVGFKQGYGNVVEVLHGITPDGKAITTTYNHLQGVPDGIQPGSLVTAGTPVGLAGSTGRSTGPHLHQEVRIDGQAVDPRLGQSVINNMNMFTADGQVAAPGMTRAQALATPQAPPLEEDFGPPVIGAPAAPPVAPGIVYSYAGQPALPPMPDDALAATQAAATRSVTTQPISLGGPTAPTTPGVGTFTGVMGGAGAPATGIPPQGMSLPAPNFSAPPAPLAQAAGTPLAPSPARPFDINSIPAPGPLPAPGAPQQGAQPPGAGPGGLLGAAMALGGMNPSGQVAGPVARDAPLGPVQAALTEAGMSAPQVGPASAPSPAPAAMGERFWSERLPGEAALNPVTSVDNLMGGARGPATGIPPQEMSLAAPFSPSASPPSPTASLTASGAFAPSPGLSLSGSPSPQGTAWAGLGNMNTPPPGSTPPITADPRPDALLTGMGTTAPPQGWQASALPGIGPGGAATPPAKFEPSMLPGAQPQTPPSISNPAVGPGGALPGAAVAAGIQRGLADIPNDAPPPAPVDLSTVPADLIQAAPPANLPAPPDLPKPPAEAITSRGATIPGVNDKAPIGAGVIQQGGPPPGAPAAPPTLAAPPAAAPPAAPPTPQAQPLNFSKLGTGTAPTNAAGQIPMPTPRPDMPAFGGVLPPGQVNYQTAGWGPLGPMTPAGYQYGPDIAAIAATGGLWGGGMPGGGGGWGGGGFGGFGGFGGGGGWGGGYSSFDPAENTHG